MNPQRIQLRRKKGWRMPPNTIKVDRSGPWGNPFVVGQPHVFAGGRPVQDRRHAYVLYRAVAPLNPVLVAAARAQLRGKNLACWCPLIEQEDVCHAAVLLVIANSEGDAAAAVLNAICPTEAAR